jgi:hypothetical protein
MMEDQTNKRLNTRNNRNLGKYPYHRVGIEVATQPQERWKILTAAGWGRDSTAHVWTLIFDADIWEAIWAHTM